MSIKSEAVAYFQTNPDANPRDVMQMFGVSAGNIYSYRKEALDGPVKVRKAKKMAKKAPQEFVTIKEDIDFEYQMNTSSDLLTETGLTEDAVDNVWKSYSQFMTREEFIGYLRGSSMDLWAAGNYAQAARRLDKLVAVTSV
jgi:hypothetical protein